VGQFITFRVARQDFVMDATRIRGLLPVHDMVVLDKPQLWVTGIASIRGHDFPVVDLRGKLGIARGSLGRQPCVVVVEVAGSRLVGFIADRVSEVLNLRHVDPGARTLRIAGRTRRMLDPDQMLTDEVSLEI
jgi:purine-binding chemotaxis protein CheW